MKKYLKKCSPFFDFILLPFVFIAALVFKFIRRAGIKYFPLSKKLLYKTGVFPITDHYYEPLFQTGDLKKSLSDERKLPGINWNTEEQIDILNTFHFQEELNKLPDSFVSETTFHFKNNSFESGDAEYWYSLIRLKKPQRIIEIGSGHSTKLARLAIEANQKQEGAYLCKHICIEPYEMPWLEAIGVEVIREKVENIPIAFFEQLEANDVLFIDSSHMIRPQGDVLFEYLELIPILKSGVIVHVHDIFSPRDYLKEWIVEEVRFWNEQYLLEAFLSFNYEWKIIGALNFLHHSHFELLQQKCPRLTIEREPGSFYMVKK